MIAALQVGYRAGEKSALVANRFYRPDGSARGVCYFHSAGGSASNLMDSNVYNVASVCAAAGLPMSAYDFGTPTVATGTTSGPLSWGNDNALTSAASAVTYMQTTSTSGSLFSGHGVAAGKYHIYAQSMGALVALNYLVSLTTPSASVLSVALVVPVLDLDNVYQNDKGSWQASIGAAYGVTPVAAIPNLATHSPVAYSAPNLAKLTMPVRIWSSSTDQVASNTTACRAWGAPNVTVRDLGDVLHANAPATINPTEVLAFFQANR